ncbi:MAG: tyrosine-protein phosphatase [Desulfovibrionales bacterium]|nr:tyrosine-protein phosphatase [Desulfovibrionales bacterium]
MAVSNLLRQINTRVDQGHGAEYGRIGKKGDLKTTEKAVGNFGEKIFNRKSLEGKTEATQKKFAEAVLGELQGKFIPDGVQSRVPQGPLLFKNHQLVGVPANKMTLEDAKLLLENAAEAPPLPSREEVAPRPSAQATAKAVRYASPQNSHHMHTGAAASAASVDAPPIPARMTAVDKALNAIKSSNPNFHDAIKGAIAERYGQDAAEQIMSSLDKANGYKSNPEFYETSPEMSKNNRYRNIVPPKHSLVPSSSAPLNANFITLNGKEMGIAMQAPKSATVDSVWSAIDQQGVDTIVDLTNAVDKNAKKIPDYRPQSSSAQRGADGYFEVIHNTAEDKSVPGIHPRTGQPEAKFDIESYTISKEDENSYDTNDKHLTAIHYNFWPDHGVVSKNDLKEIVDTIDQNKGDGKLLIHCTAGVGRTGTVFSALALKDMAKSGELTPQNAEQKVLDLIIDGRISRGASFVQTPDQAKLLIDYAHDLVG